MSTTDAAPEEPLDLVGVGIGPFNLSLAALAHRVEGLRTRFLEQRPGFSWHPGLLLEGTTLQVPFLADLVTMADPTSPWSFLAYLQAHDRLFPFYFAERFHVPRREYDHYCRWVAESLPTCRFGAEVTAVDWDDRAEAFRVTWRDVATGEPHAAAARNVVLGLGTAPAVPPAFAAVRGKHAFHAADYLDHRPDLDTAGDVTVVGSGQSGAEVFLDLLRAQPDTGHRLRWLTRSPAFAPMEYSKLGLEHFTPDYMAHFHGLPEAVRERRTADQWQLYKAISAETIAEIHDLLYDRSVGGRQVPATLTPNVEVTGARHVADGIELTCRDRDTGVEQQVATDRVVLATGYAPRPPVVLDPMRHRVDWDAAGRFRVDLDFRVQLDPAVTGGLYVQNAERHTHGVGSPDLGLGAWRAATILNDVTGEPVLHAPRRTAFTTFGLA